jgi:hypothetical protein
MSPGERLYAAFRRQDATMPEWYDLDTHEQERHERAACELLRAYGFDVWPK